MFFKVESMQVEKEEEISVRRFPRSADAKKCGQP
jgi:hypothetical protein